MVITLNNLKRINFLRSLKDEIISKKIYEDKIQKEISRYSEKISISNDIRFYRLRNHLLSTSLKTRNEIRLLQAKLELELLKEPWIYENTNIYNYLTTI